MSFDIPLFKVLMDMKAPIAVAEVLMSGQVAQGPQVDAFERELADALGVPIPSVVSTSSGTAALHLAYHLAGVQPGDAVIVTPMTCSATITPLIHLGARIVWADIDRMTGNIDPASVAEQLDRIELGRIPSRTHRPACVVGVDWGGRPVNYDMLRHVVPMVIPIVEDAAHAFGAMRLVPGVGTTPVAAAALRDHVYACFSFQAIKHLNTGDGGALVVPEYAGALGIGRARKLRWFGLDRTSKKDFRCEQDIDEAGYKFHMNDIAAAIGRANLPGALAAVQIQRDNAFAYHNAFRDQGRVTVPPPSASSAWWLYTLLVDDRESFQKHMHARGIQTSQVHRRNDHVFPQLRTTRGELPGVDFFSEHQVSIPVGWWLSLSARERVIDGVLSWAR